MPYLLSFIPATAELRQSALKNSLVYNFIAPDPDVVTLSRMPKLSVRREYRDGYDDGESYCDSSKLGEQTNSSGIELPGAASRT